MKKTSPIPNMLSCMTAFPYSVSMKDTIERARDIMRENDIRHLGVWEESVDNITRVISQRDIEKAQVLGSTTIDASLTVSRLCPALALSVDIDDYLDNALNIMAAKKVGSVLVKKNNKVVGIFTATDAAQLFADHLEKEHPTDLPDIIA